jgi:hypothetical protein
MYLKRFDPIAPEPIPTIKLGYAVRRPLRLACCLAAFAVMILVATLILHIRNSRVVLPTTVREAASAETRGQLEPLTMRSATAWLTTAPSFKAAIDDLAFRSQSDPIPQGKQSAVAVLRKEKIKL